MLSIQNFASAANQGFALSLGDSTIALTLVEVKPLPVHPFPGMLREPFSLLFRSASPVVLPQRIYRLEHAGIGKLDMFLVPLGRDPHGVLYQAVHN